MTEISCDFETRSAVDLRKTGVYPYAEHASTDVWCFAFDHPGLSDPLVWTPGDDFETGVQLREMAEDPTFVFRAWNAPFERIVWREIMAGRYGFPDIPLERWVCTAAEARAMGLPGKLDDSAKVLSVVDQKDMQGHRLMLQMSKPRSANPDGTFTWWDQPDKIERLIAYCRQDVRTEKAIAARLQRLSEYERQVWLMDQRANDRGILVDVPLAKAARAIADRVQADANVDMAKRTDGAVAAVTNVGQLKAWLGEKGTVVDSLSKKAVAELLDDPELPDPVREALELRAETGKSSVKKIDAMLRAVCSDNALRGLLLYWGAGTGRWAGRLVQPQNFPARTAGLPDWHEPEAWIDPVMRQDISGIDLYAPPLEVVSLLLRSMLRARDGHALVAADYSAIEARVIAWLCGEEWRLEVFRTHGMIYEASASMMFKVPIETIQYVGPNGKKIKGENYALRQKGKAAELALGFQGGPNALITMGALEQGLTEEELPEIVKLWRAASPAIVAGWYNLQDACLEAVRFPGKVTEGLEGRIRFKVSGGWLWLKLPSGRRLAYCQPRMVEKPAPWDPERLLQGVEAWSVNSKTKKWSKRSLYGGLLMENVVQATARDLMADAMLRLEAGGVFTPLLSVHDEIVTEALEHNADPRLLETIMSEIPDWAAGCPVTAEGWAGLRYRK
jgi:DNA polymerase bacteriophage-type